MAYKDRMIASRSIAAAVREARIEMKKLADAKHVTTTGATLPAPHRRGVPTSTRLREAVRRDLKSLEKFAGEVIAKAAGSTEADALIEELTTAAEKFMDAEAPDDLWEEWDDSLRKLWGRLAPAAASVYDNAYAGAYGRLINSLDKLYEVLADLTDSGVNAEEIAGVDYDDMYEIAEQLLEETDKSAGDVTAKAAGDTEADALLEELTQAAGKLMELEAPDDLWEEWDSDERNGWNRLATAASAVYDETMLGSTQCSSKRLSSALSKLEQVLADLQDYVQVDAEEMAGVDYDDMLEAANQYYDEMEKSAGDVATKSAARLESILDALLKGAEGSIDDATDPTGEYLSDIQETLNGLDGITDPDEARALASQLRELFDAIGNGSSADLDELDDYISGMGGDGTEEASAGDSVNAKTIKGVTTTADDLWALSLAVEEAGLGSDVSKRIEEAATALENDDSSGAADIISSVVDLLHGEDVDADLMSDLMDAASNLGRKGSPSSTRTKKSELDGALADIQYDVAQINRIVDAEDDGSAEMEAWKAAYNTWVSTAESATDEDPTEGLPDALDALVEAATDLQGHYIDQDMVDSLMSAIDSYNSIVTRSASDVTTKASSLSDVEERLGAAMNAMGKAASAADKAGAETEDPDEADAASALSELCSDIAGDLQATDADDRDGIQGLMDQITEIEITIRDEAAAEQVGTFTEKARAALEEALELLSAYEGKSATGSKSSTRTKATDPTEFVDRLNGAREGLNTLLEGSEDIHETDAINQALDMVDQAMTAAGDENWDGAADLLSDAASYLDGVIGSESTAEALNAFAEEARGVNEYEERSYSAASRAKRRAGLDTKRAGEGELEALIRDYETFAMEYMADIEAASDAVRNEATTDEDGEYGDLVAEIEDLGIEESFDDTPMATAGEAYEWSAMASGLKSMMGNSLLNDEARSELELAMTALTQFAGDEWWSQYNDEQDVD